MEPSNKTQSTEVSDEMRVQAIAQTLDKYKNELKRGEHFSETFERIFSDIVDSMKTYVFAKRSIDSAFIVLYNAKLDLQHIFSQLTEGFPDHEGSLGGPLWRIWDENAFDTIDRRWLRDERVWANPILLRQVSYALACYRENIHLRHPYIAWALINAYLLALGLDRRLTLEDDCVYHLTQANLRLREADGKPMRTSRCAHLFYCHIMKEDISQLTLLREMIEGNVKCVSRPKEIMIVVVLAISGFLRSTLLGVCTSIFSGLGYLILNHFQNKLMRDGGQAIEQILSRAVEKLRSCRLAWKAANTTSVYLPVLRVRIKDLANTMEDQTSPILWLVDDAVERWGETLDVSSYM